MEPEKIKTQLQLAKYIRVKYPDNYIMVQHELYSHSGKIKSRYSAYINNTVLGKYSHSPAFGNIKRLIEFVIQKIK